MTRRALPQAKRALSLMDGRAVSYDGRMPTTLQARTACTLHRLHPALPAPSSPCTVGTRAPPAAPPQVRAAHANKSERPPTPLAGRVLWVGQLPLELELGLG